MRVRSRAAIVLVVCMFASLVAHMSRQRDAPAPLSIGPIEIDAPESVPAGESFRVTVESSNPGEVLLVVDSGYGPRTFTSPLVGGSASIDVPPADGPESGVTLVEAIVGEVGTTTTVEVVPGAPTSPVDVYLGPRTVVTGGSDFSLVVAVPEDEFGNPVGNGTVVDFSLTRPTLLTEHTTSTTKGLIAFAEIKSQTRAGRTRVATTSGTAGSAEQSLLEVPGFATSIDLIRPPFIHPADGASLLELRSTNLKDVFDNELSDGAIVYLDAVGSTGTRRLTGFAIGGIASFVVEVPDRPGPAEFVLRAGGVSSTPLRIDFAPAVREIPVSVQTTKRDMEIAVGPVLTTRGAFVPDGTIARLIIGNEAHELALEEGVGAFTAPLSRDPISVSVLGVGAKTIKDERS